MTPGVAFKESNRSQSRLVAADGKLQLCDHACQVPKFTIFRLICHAFFAWARVHAPRNLDALMQPIRRAVIDVGTNSIKLLVADVAGRDVLPLHEESRQTRLGRGFYETHRLQPDAIAR